MYRIHLTLYGTPQAREAARCLLCNLQEVKHEEQGSAPWNLRFVLNAPIKENSLIPLLRQSGIHGFRLVEED